MLGYAPQSKARALSMVSWGSGDRRIDVKLPIKIECYNCEEPIEVCFDTLRSHTEYGKCQCGEGVQVCLIAGVLHIDRLPEEQGGVLWQKNWSLVRFVGLKQVIPNELMHMAVRYGKYNAVYFVCLEGDRQKEKLSNYGTNE